MNEAEAPVDPNPTVFLEGVNAAVDPNPTVCLGWMNLGLRRPRRLLAVSDIFTPTSEVPVRIPLENDPVKPRDLTRERYLNNLRFNRFILCGLALLAVFANILFLSATTDNYKSVVHVTGNNTAKAWFLLMHLLQWVLIGFFVESAWSRIILIVDATQENPLDMVEYVKHQTVAEHTVYTMVVSYCAWLGMYLYHALLYT